MRLPRSLLAVATLVLALGAAEAQNIFNDEDLNAPLLVFQTMRTRDDLSMFVEAIKRAKFAKTLGSKSFVTVFAPSNAAFAKMGKANVDVLFADKKKLKEVLKFHVTSTKTVNDLRESAARMSNGEIILIEEERTGMRIGNARIVETDIPASNGVIHIIDTVLELPQTVFRVLSKLQDFSTFFDIVTKAGLAEFPHDKYFDLTVFAPTNAAFAKLPQATLDSITGNKDLLIDTIKFHVSSNYSRRSPIRARDMKDGEIYSMDNDKEIMFNVDGDTISIKPVSEIVSLEIKTTNGLIHGIDTVLMQHPGPVKVMRTRDDLSMFVEAIKRAKFAKTLGSEPLITIFAPSNAAFAKMGKANLDALFADDNQLLRILNYHIVNRIVKTPKKMNSKSIHTVSGGIFKFDVDKSGIKVGNAGVIETDIPTMNGVIHIIDAFLEPPKHNVRVELERNKFSTFIDLVTKAGLADLLTEDELITVFAPTNAAFAKLTKATLDSFTGDKDLLVDMMRYHILGYRLIVDDITDKVEQMFNEKNALFNVKGDTISINNSSKIILPDIMATNGVIHGIDIVLLQPLKIVKTMRTRDDLSMFVEAIKRAKFGKTLGSKSSVTVFAPSNAAFAKMGKANLDALFADKNKLREMLKHHVTVDISATSTQVAAVDNSGGLWRTLGWDSIIIMASESGIRIGNARIVETDISASNGVIHIIDTVLNDSQNTFRVLSELREYSTFVDLFKKAKFKGSLINPYHVTVFAPTNAAFAKLPQAKLNELAGASKGALRRFLEYHMIKGQQLLADDFIDGTELRTAYGFKNIGLNVDGDSIIVNGNSQIIQPNIKATNGVIHSIDTVLEAA